MRGPFIVVVLLLSGLVSALPCLPALADAVPVFGAHDVATMFHISKSQNRNRVEYGIRLNENCRPRGHSPVFAYWRMLERGPRELEALGRREHRAYGISHQHVTSVGHRSWIRVQLRALEARDIDIVALRTTSGRCAAAARTRIAGNEAELHSVHVQLGNGLIPRVRGLVIRGQSVASGTAVREHVAP